MAYRIQNRRDTAERWAEVNPVLLEGEIGYVTDNPNQYKIGDGKRSWNELPFRGYTGTISQELGVDENAVVSQKVVTVKLSEVGNRLDEQNNEISDFKKTITDQVNNYKPIEINGNVTNAPDEEDITSENGLLKLKNRNNLNGMGRIILRMDKTLVEQLTQTNTIYEIRYNFDLNGAEITIPEGCVLDFRGGSLNSGSIVCNNTILKGSINGDVSINGTFYKYNYVIPKDVDVTDLLQKILDENKYLYLERGTYLISRPLVIKKSGTAIIGESPSSNGTVIKAIGNISSMITTMLSEDETSGTHTILTYITIRDILFAGNNLSKNGIYYLYDSNCYFENVRVTGCTTGFSVHGWSHTFVHCSAYGNILGGTFNNAFNQCSFIGCFFNTNKVGFYAEGTNVLFYGCDIEKNSITGCICGGSSVEMRECYFESNATIGLVYASNYNTSESDCYYYPNGGNIYTQNLKADVITRVNPRILNNDVVAIGFSNAWLADNVNISHCYFNSNVDCAVIGSASKIKITENVFEIKYPCVYGIIPSFNITIVKQMEIYNNYEDRSSSDAEKIEPIQSIKPFYDNAKINYLFWNFLQNNKHKIYTGYSCRDFGKNIYNFNSKIKGGEHSISTTKLKIESYNNKDVIYKAELLGSDNFDFGFHTYASDGSSMSDGLIPDTIYCYEAELKLSRELLDGESVKFNFTQAGVHSQVYTIDGLSTNDYIKVYFYIYNDGNRPSNWFESNLYGSSIQEEVLLYIKNPKFYNICMDEDNSDYYFSYLKYSARNPADYNRPYTSGVRVGERMSYFGSDETLKKRNLVCVKTGEGNQCDTWADISYDVKGANNIVPQVKLETITSSNNRSGVYAEKPTNANVGFAYFCTDRQSTEGSTDGIVLYHKGSNIWVDALGRVVK